jgi:hypothetical protein
MPRSQGLRDQLHGSVTNLVASRLLTCTVDHVDLPNKLAYLLRPGQTVLEQDAKGYLGDYGLVAGISVTVPVSLTISGTTYTQTITLVIRPPLAKGDQVVAVETGGSLFIVGTVDK